jgi:hypothetical protein
MFFSTTEHYQDNFVIIPNEIDCCFICLENENNYCNLIMLSHQQIYFCYCRCNGWIHHTCLQQWLNMNQTCPICRRHVIKNACLQQLIDNNQSHPMCRIYNTHFVRQFVKHLLTFTFFLFVLMYYYIVGKTYVYIFDSILFIKLHSGLFI